MRNFARLAVVARVVATARSDDCRAARRPNAPALYLVDHPSRLLLLATPKAGATLAVQTMFHAFESAERLEKWRRLCPWVHACKSKFDALTRHRPFRVDPCRACRGGNHTCVALVRDPFRRAVSSYAAVMRHARAATRAGTEPRVDGSSKIRTKRRAGSRVACTSSR